MSQEVTLFLTLEGASIGLLGKELGLMNETNNGVRIIFPSPLFLFYRTTYKEVKTRDSIFREDILLLIITETCLATGCTQEVLHASSHLVPARLLWGNFRQALQLLENWASDFGSHSDEGVTVASVLLMWGLFSFRILWLCTTAHINLDQFCVGLSLMLILEKNGHRQKLKRNPGMQAHLFSYSFIFIFKYFYV